MSREAALRFNVFNDYTYTLETIIQAGQKSIAITSVPVRVNRELRPSRLVKSIPSYLTNPLSPSSGSSLSTRPSGFSCRWAAAFLRRIDRRDQDSSIIIFPAMGRGMSSR